MTKQQNIQKILNKYLLLAMIVITTVFTCLFCILEYQSQYKMVNNEMERTTQAIAEDIDLQIKQMDTVCLNTINSTIVKENFSDYIKNKAKSPYQVMKYKENLANTLTSIKGVDDSIRQVNIFDRDTTGYGCGNYTGPITKEVSKLVWYEDATTANGRLSLLIPTTNPLFSIKSGADSGQIYFPLVRMYFNEFHLPVGYVEVLKYYDVLFERAFHSSDNLDVVIQNSTGDIIYPLYPSDEQRKSFSKYSVNGNERIHYYSALTKYSNFTITTTVESSTLFAPIYERLVMILLLFIFALLACYQIASILSKRLSAPIKAIYHQLQEKDFNNNLEELVLPDSHIIEIEKLKNSLNDSLRSRKESMETMMVLKEQEMQAKMLALQSQMNPHFLYNSLNTIGAMAEEGLNEPISEMCRYITSILRYISSDAEQTSSVEGELEQCDLYLKCLSLRYGDTLSYKFDIEDELLDYAVPKLCIQLLVENAAKFTTTTSPPWKIEIFGRALDEYWYVEVRDNGPGFDAATAKKLREQMDEILATGLLPSLEINGMGILNIFIRLYLINGIPFIFDFGNLETVGAFVRIGGTYEDKTTD